MSGLLRAMLIALVIMYIVSPVDIVSGSPLDDIIVLLLGIAAQKKFAE